MQSRKPIVEEGPRRAVPLFLLERRFSCVSPHFMFSGSSCAFPAARASVIPSCIVCSMVKRGRDFTGIARRGPSWMYSAQLGLVIPLRITAPLYFGPCVNLTLQVCHKGEFYVLAADSMFDGTQVSHFDRNHACSQFGLVFPSNRTVSMATSVSCSYGHM